MYERAHQLKHAFFESNSPLKWGVIAACFGLKRVRLSSEKKERGVCVCVVRECKNNHSRIFTELVASFEMIRRQWVNAQTRLRASIYFQQRENISAVVISHEKNRQAATIYIRYNIARDEVLARDKPLLSFGLKRRSSLLWYFFYIKVSRGSFFARVYRARVARRQNESESRSLFMLLCVCSWWADFCHDHGNNIENTRTRERKIKHDTEAPPRFMAGRSSPWG